MSKQAESNLRTLNLISSSTKITGDIITDDDIRIDGNVQGNLNTKGRLIIGANGNIKGEIICKAAEIEGIVNGSIIVSDLLTIKSSAKIEGTVNTKQLMIEPGAVFTGNCKMNNATEEKSK